VLFHEHFARRGEEILTTFEPGVKVDIDSESLLIVMTKGVRSIIYSFNSPSIQLPMLYADFSWLLFHRNFIIESADPGLFF
jgi:hypothetical protein